jgi:hypothetical protein
MTGRRAATRLASTGGATVTRFWPLTIQVGEVAEAAGVRATSPWQVVQVMAMTSSAPFRCVAATTVVLL